LPSRSLSLLAEGEHTVARLTLGGPSLLDEPVALTPLTPSTPKVGASWSALDAVRIHPVPASPNKSVEQPTPLRWSAGSLRGPALLAQEDSARVTPALVVATNGWLAYRYRSAYDITTLFPLYSVGLSLNGDLL
jgi:hypothetical protein